MPLNVIGCSVELHLMFRVQFPVKGKPSQVALYCTSLTVTSCCVMVLSRIETVVWFDIIIHILNVH